MKKLYFIILLAILFSSCNGNWVPIDVDKTLGEQSSNQIENSPEQFKLLEREDCPYAFERIESIRDQILETGEIKYASDFVWDIHIVKDDSVLNAFCLPGGNIYIYTGLIKYLDSEAGLAGVIGHEMAHADLRHSTKQLVQNLGLSLFIQYVLGVDQSSLINMGANLLSLSFSRSDESDADMRSVEYLGKTNYDPRGAAFFFEKIEKEQNEHPSLEFINTHPNPDNRVKKIYEKWKDLGGKKGELQKETYKKIIQDLQ
jgi:predicted Zn-dependent protease